jgi:hypothetical protein
MVKGHAVKRRGHSRRVNIGTVVVMRGQYHESITDFEPDVAN